MITERRMTLTGTWVEVPKRLDPREMTDRELKKKVCAVRKGTCADCVLLNGCKYGKEYIRRFEEGNNK